MEPTVTVRLQPAQMGRTMLKKIAYAAVQVALVVVALHGAACTTATAAAPKQTARAETLDPELVALSNAGPLHFETNSDVLTEDSQRLLQRVAAQMFSHAEVNLVVTGHADERGDTMYNLALGERRGEAARAYLKKLGVPQARVRIVSLGEEQPAAAGHDEGAWALNRRDEFDFVKKGEAQAVLEEGELDQTSRVVFTR